MLTQKPRLFALLTELVYLPNHRPPFSLTEWMHCSLASIGEAEPVYINTVREPVGRLLSQYYYDRCAVNVMDGLTHFRGRASVMKGWILDWMETSGHP